MQDIFCKQKALKKSRFICLISKAGLCCSSERRHVLSLFNERPAPARGYFLPGAYAVILPPAESDEIMREGPARRKTSLSVSESGNSIGF